MDVVIAVIFFILSMFFCVANGYSMAIALFLGVIAFSVVGCRRGPEHLTASVWDFLPLSF